MKSTSLPCSVRNTNRSLVSSKLSVPDIFLLYPKTPPSYFALTLGGAGGGAGMFVAGSFASRLVVRGRCANAVVAIRSAMTAVVHLRKMDIGLFQFLRGNSRINRRFSRARELPCPRLIFACLSQLIVGKSVSRRSQRAAHEGVNKAVLQVTKDERIFSFVARICFIRNQL